MKKFKETIEHVILFGGFTYTVDEKVKELRELNISFIVKDVNHYTKFSFETEEEKILANMLVFKK